MAESAGDARHILVVYDTEEIIELFRDIIEGMGHRASAMSYAPEDLAEVKRINPDLVILDLMMGGSKESGWALLQKLRMDPSTARLPAIVCTAAVQEVREQEGWLTSKGVKIVLKPFEVEDLELAINKAIALPGLVFPSGDAAAVQ